jgi:hypothetical protein
MADKQLSYNVLHPITAYASQRSRHCLSHRQMTMAITQALYASAVLGNMKKWITIHRHTANPRASLIAGGLVNGPNGFALGAAKTYSDSNQRPQEHQAKKHGH